MRNQVLTRVASFPHPLLRCYGERLSCQRFSTDRPLKASILRELDSDLAFLASSTVPRLGGRWNRKGSIMIPEA